MMLQMMMMNQQMQAAQMAALVGGKASKPIYFEEILYSYNEDEEVEVPAVKKPRTNNKDDKGVQE
eukprot:scaffold3079_cov174-Amphora_coffeaeformis.AAC.10